MRELVFKNLISEDRTKKDLYISEVVDKNGMRTVMTRHSIYKIGDHNKITNPEEITKWHSNQIRNNKRQVFILKRRDTKLKKDIFACDVVGDLYVVVDDILYSIAFKHSFEVDFLSIQR